MFKFKLPSNDTLMGLGFAIIIFSFYRKEKRD